MRQRTLIVSACDAEGRRRVFARARGDEAYLLAALLRETRPGSSPLVQTPRQARRDGLVGRSGKGV
jgi:hypothetical protein